MSSQLNVARLRQLLGSSSLGTSIVNLVETDSTMDDATKLISSGYVSHGTVICAEFQKQGQGRVEGRVWESNASKNILCTVCLKKTTIDDPPTRVAIVTPLSIAKALRKLGVNAAVKWPNDVIAGGKKVSGMMVKDGGDYWILGFGVNVNQRFSDNSTITQPATSVVDELKLEREVSREALLADILKNLGSYLQKEFSEILVAFRENDALVGQEVTIFPKGREQTDVFEKGTAVGIDENGFLVVEIDGKEKTLVAEEVSVRLENLPAHLRNGKLPRASSEDTISGIWTNQLGSVLTLVAGAEGVLTGTYQTAVGNVPVGREYPLHGSHSALPDGGALVGWVVCWNQEDGLPRSSTSWSGRLHLDESSSVREDYRSKPFIDSTWLLTSEKPAWESVLTNKDVFVKRR